ANFPQVVRGERRVRPPERDRVVQRVVAVLLAVVGDVEEERIPPSERAMRALEPAPEVVLGGRTQLDARDRGVGVRDRRRELVLEARAAEQPELGLGLYLAHREVLGRVGAVGTEDRYPLRPHAGVE